jgi:predicted Zn-dependent protease
MPQYGYPQQAGYPQSPFNPGDAPSFTGQEVTPPMDPTYQAGLGFTSYQPGGTAMMAFAPTASVAGLKFTYHNQSGDYSSTQSRNSGRWEQFPVTMHLSFPEEMSDKHKQVVKSAVSAWQKHVDITLVEAPEQAKIELTWTTDLENEDFGETEFAATHVDTMGRTILDKVIIKMLDPKKYKKTKPGAFKSAVMHQVGHALGINSHSDNERDLMCEPSLKQVKSPIVRKAMRSLASKTLGQFIDINTEDEDDDKPTGPPVDKITKRDLNTLYRLYN